MDDALKVVDPVVTDVHVGVRPDKAFRLFTHGMGEWWPLEEHSIAVDSREGSVKTTALVFEGREGGLINESMSDGSEAPWGQVLGWDPPTLVVFSWKPNLSDGPHTEIEVRFTPSDEGTEVRLEHRGWERFGDEANERRRPYEIGWPGVLDLYRSATSG